MDEIIQFAKSAYEQASQGINHPDYIDWDRLGTDGQNYHIRLVAFAYIEAVKANIDLSNQALETIQVMVKSYGSGEPL